jgi:hypothetical protein
VAIGAFHEDAFDLDAFSDSAFLFEEAGVLVPNVVGQSQASATTELEGDGFVVAVSTAHSSIVPAGDVISQSPAAGLEVPAGSTVTITVSLGEAATPPVQENAGGGFLMRFESGLDRRRKRQQELEEAEEAIQQLTDSVDREIATLLQKQERQDEADEDLKRLQQLVAGFADREAEQAMSERVRTALTRAQTQANVSAFLALDRELQRMLEEEEFAVLMMLLED